MAVCTHCNIREGTQQWIGEGGMLAVSHGFYQLWCEVCVFGAQVAYAEEQAKSIPALKAKLAEALTRLGGPAPATDYKSFAADIPMIVINESGEPYEASGDSHD